MSYDFYKLVHFAGIFITLSALGAQCGIALSGMRPKESPARKWVAMGHGVGLVLALVAGFGLLARLGFSHTSAESSFPAWTWLKLAIWLVLGGAGALVARKPQYAGPCWVAVLALAVLGAYIARTKPF